MSFGYQVLGFGSGGEATYELEYLLIGGGGAGGTPNGGGAGGVAHPAGARREVELRPRLERVLADPAVPLDVSTRIPLQK